MAYKDERELSYTAKEQAVGTQTIAEKLYKPYYQPLNFAPMQVQAEAGQDWEEIAKATGVEVGDLVKANPLDTDVKAGAVYNVPQQPLSMVTGSELKAYQQPYYDVAKIPPGMTVKEYNESQVPPIPTPEPRNYIMELLTSGGGREGEQLGETINRFTQPIRDWILPQPALQSGGGSADIQTQQQPVSAVTGSQQYQQPYNQMAYRMGGSRAVPQYQYPEGSVNIGGTGQAQQYAPALDPAVIGRQEQAQELRKIPLPPRPSAFEAVNWLTGAGLTGTALLSAGHQLRLDRPEYWDATGGREDVLAGMEKFLIAEFPDGNGWIDWDAAIAQDPYIGETLEKLGYHAPPSGLGEDYGGEASYGGYSYPLPSYGGSGYNRPYQGRQRQAPARLGLVSWSGM